MAIVNYTAATDLLSFTADAGEANNVTVTSPAANMVRIVVVGDTISLTGDTGAGFTLSGGGTQLDINTTTAPAVNFNVNLGDLGDTLTFGLANASNGVTNVNLQGDAGTDTVTLSALTITGNLSVASETINLGGIVTAGGNVTLTAVNSLTDGADNDVADISGAVVSLTVTGAGNMIGAGAADFLEVDAATRLDAATNNGLIAVKNVSGNLPLGAINAGNNFIFLTARNGAITDANGAAVNLTAANGVSLTTVGNSSAIGTAGDAIETAIGALTVTTNDGGIYIADSNGPGLIINSVLAKEGGQTPFINGSNQIVLNTGNTQGTNDVSISAQGDILLNTVTAPDAVTITSVAGRILDINQASNNILSRSVNLVASGMIGQDGDAIESTVETFSASTTNGSIFLAPLLVSTAASVVAGGAGNDVSIATTVSSLRIQTISAPDVVTVANIGGSLLDDNGAAVNITGQIVSLTGSAGIGTALDPLDTSAADLRATASDAAAGIYVNEADALTAITVKTNAGKVTINFTGGPLAFDPSTQLLSLSGTAALTFETTTGDIKLGLVDSGTSAVSITAAGAIMDDVNDAAVDLRGGAVTLKAGTGIGVSGNEIDSDIATLIATTTNGGVFIREANAITVSASSMTGNVDVRNAAGNMTVGLVSASGQVTLHAGGAILDGNGVNNNLSAPTLVLVASNGIGSGGDGLETLVDSLSANGGAGGGLLIANNKALTVTSATATGGAVSISATGSLTLAGAVVATGQSVALRASGNLIDANAVGADITAASVMLNAAKMGFGDRIETATAAITATTTSGGIYLSNTAATLTLNATAVGAAADIDINTTGNIVLGVATAQGDTVKLLAGGSITDGNDPPVTVNVTAKKVDITAPGGIGTEPDPVEMDVDVVVAADGGAAGAFITFTGPLLLTETALEAAGAGTLTFDAESITIENIADNTATIAAGRSLVLRTPAGAIVFLDAADTIETSGAGSITVQAGTEAGIGEIAVAVLGNLKTAGGNILVEADRTITIGLLDAGTGDVTVKSEASIIIDGNGPALNVIAGSTTLSGAGRTDREAELDETFQIAGAAAAAAEAAAKQTAADALGSGQAILDAEVATQTGVVEAAVVDAEIKTAAYTAKQTLVNNLTIAATAADVAALAATTAATAALIIAGPAQAIPLVGDAGTFAIQATIQVVANVLEGVSAGLAIGLTVESIALIDIGYAATVADFTLNSAQDRLALGIVVQQAFAESSSITLAAAANAAIVRDASERIRDQAVLARDQANVIGTFAEPLGIQVTGVINVTAGPTDSYLQVVGPTAVDLIQTTGSVTLISTGTITDADAGPGADILGTGLRIIAVGGIGSAADPIETRVATLSASNSGGGDIAISNTVGTPGPLDITGISNTGGGNVIIANQGSTAAGQGITVSGPISATGAGAGINIASGSPLTISADLTSAAAILLTAAESPVAGDDLTLNSGVTLESTGSSVTLRAGDNILVSAGSTIKAATTITITADFTDVDATGANVVVAGALVATSALINVDPAANDNDTFTITPSVGAPITVDAEDGSDTLNFIADGLPVTILGNVITAAGRAPVTFLNFEFVNIINTNGGGNITLNTAAGNVDALILTGTGQKAGTFTLNAGIPISFTGVDSFTFNAGDMADTATVSPFATSVLPWNVAVKIDGGAGADRIIYNNVAGLRDTTEVTATAPQAGHIDSPGVTSALHSQLVTFTNVEDLTVNANVGEDEKLIVNLRDTFAADTANLLFDPAPGADDLQLVGLFDMVIDTTNYVGLTLNGRGGDDTFNVTPGPIPVFVDGGDPIGSTAGDTINFNPAGAYVLEPGPQNDEGGLNAVGAQRVSWDHIEGISVTGGTQGVFLGTNGDDDITIIARDSSTHAGADGVRDFTVSLNNGPSVLFINAPAFFVDALAGDDDIELRAPAPNNAVWDLVGMTLRGNDGSDRINAAIGVGSTSPITLEGGAGDDFLEGGAGSDRFFGNEGNDTFVGGPGNDTYDGGLGDDVLLIDGAASSLSFAGDTLTLVIGAQINIYQLINLEDIALTTGGGDDDVVITNVEQFSGALTTDLGDGFDRVTYVSTITDILLSNYPAAVFNGAPRPGSGVGRLSLDNVGTRFANVEELNLGGSGQTVDYRAPDGGHAIHVLGMGATTELRFDTDAKVVLKNSPTKLNLSGLSGEDTFIVDPNAGTSLTEINIAGREFYGADQLVLNGRTAADSMNYSPGPAFGAGNVQFNALAVNFKFIEGMSFNGQGGADAMTLTTPAGNTIVQFTPGANANAGSLKLHQQAGSELLGFSYVNVNGTTATLSVANSGGLGDSLIVDGTGGDDVFTVTAVAGGTVRLGNPALPNSVQSVLITTPGVAWLELHGGDGDDVFHIPGNHSYTGFPGVPGINIQGGNPSASDVLNFGGAGGAITVELGPNTVQEGAFSPVTYTGVERVNIQSALTSSLAVNGTGGEETLNFKMNASGQGTFTAVSDGPFVANYPVFTYVVAAANVITINTQGGNDTLGLIATTGNDVINVIQSAANTLSYTQNTFTQAFNVSNLDLVKVDALAGNDLIRISVSDTLIASPNDSLAFSVDGGPTSGNDRLIVNDDDKGDLTILRQAPDQRSGSATVGTLNPVFYTNIARFDMTPVNPITGGVGSDGAGRTVVFHSDPFEYNETRLTAASLSRVGESATRPTIDPGAVSAPFSVPGDEDWYDFRPQATGTFAVKILFDKIATLTNGRTGLPGDGDLSLDIYDANGVLITSGVVNLAGTSKTATFGATNDPAFPQFNRIYVRVHGATPNSINLYEFDNLGGVGTGNPGVGNADLFGPQITNIQVNSVPSATYNLFNSKDADNALHPTPLTNSLLISFRDLPQRAPGFIYPALDPTTATTPGTYVLRGDASGIIAISSIIIEPGTNLPPGVGGLATGQVRLVFANPLPDDRFTLTINDTLLDPAGNKLDGESNAAEPNGEPLFPSGNTQAGGNFVARFTVDTRVELGTYSSGSVYVDTNGNYSFDPTNTDATNRDITYQMGFTSDNIFAGNFVKGLAGIADGFDKLAAYGKVGTTFRWIIDVNNDGIVNASDVTVNQPLFPGVTNVNGMPVAGNFDGNAANGDEVALKVGNTWLLDKVDRDFKVDTKLPGTNMVGLPIVGDFDNDGFDDLGSWADNKFYLNFSSLHGGTVNGTADKIFTFGFASVRERPVAGDFDGDGITDLGLWVPDRAGVAPSEAAEWYLFLSGGTAVGRGGIAGQGQTILDRLNAPDGVVFTPAPFGNDKFAQFGDEFGLPVPGNFDPPITSAQPTGGFTNPQLNLDVNNDGIVSAFDALVIINRLNSGNTALTSTPFTPTPFVDVNGDGICSAMDALLIVNWLNTHSAGSEVSSAGEAVHDSVFAELGDEAGPDESILALLAEDANGGRKR